MNSIVAIKLNCYQQSPEKLEDGKEKVLGVVTDCGWRANSCIKIDTQAGIGQEYAVREGIGAVYRCWLED